MVTEEQEMQFLDFLKDNKLLCNKFLMGYKDPNKQEALWDGLCKDTKMEKDACKHWFKSHMTMYGK